jgi:hypothetical protein
MDSGKEDRTGGRDCSMDSGRGGEDRREGLLHGLRERRRGQEGGTAPWTQVEEERTGGRDCSMDSGRGGEDRREGLLHGLR